MRITTFRHEWQRPPTSDEIAAEAERLSARVGYDSGPLGSYIPVRVTATAWGIIRVAEITERLVDLADEITKWCKANHMPHKLEHAEVPMNYVIEFGKRCAQEVDGC